MRRECRSNLQSDRSVFFVAQCRLMRGGCQVGVSVSGCRASEQNQNRVCSASAASPRDRLSEVPTPHPHTPPNEAIESPTMSLLMQRKGPPAPLPRLEGKEILTGPNPEIAKVKGVMFGG